MKIGELLSQCGVKKSDTVIVYCALDSGEKECAELLRCLTEFLDTGCLVMPTGGGPDCFVPNGIFDPERTPSGKGALSEMFRSLPGAVRSRHPAGSLTALGQDAAWLMEGHECCTSEFSASSPWWKLFQKGAKCLFIGCGLEHSCMIAAAEEWAGAASFFKRVRRRRLALGNGRNKRLRIREHSGRHRRNYPKIEELLRDSGLLLRCRWDHCDVLLMDSSAVVTQLLHLLRRKQGLFASKRRLKNLKIC